MDCCKLKSCVEPPTTTLLRCDGCAQFSMHESCYSPISNRSPYLDSFKFCCVSCIDSGPLVLPPDVEKTAGKLSKRQLKSYLHSKELRVFDDNGKDLLKSFLVETLIVYNNSLLQNEEYSRLQQDS
jgi:hypothetical protein